jgi:serine/threonine protein kinase
VTSDNRFALPSGYVCEGIRIERELGSGGFGITYLATDLALDRRVAVKEYLPAGIALREGNTREVRPISESQRETYEWGLRRFRDEARVLVQFRHPNIVTVHRFFEALVWFRWSNGRYTQVR